MRLWALLALCVPCLAQFCATATSLPFSATDLSLGAGKNIGVWTLSARPIGPAPITLSRVEILERFPELRVLPTWMTVDVLARSAYRDRRSTLARIATVALRLAPAALSLAGLATGTDAATYSGLGLGAATALVQGFTARTPDPAPATTHLLPDGEVVLGTSGGTWIVVSGLVRNATTLGPRCSSIQATQSGNGFTAGDPGAHFSISGACAEAAKLDGGIQCLGATGSANGITVVPNSGVRLGATLAPGVYPAFPPIAPTVARFERPRDIWELAAH